MASDPNIVPWGLHPLKSWIVPELESRSKEVNINDATISGNGVWSGQYSGPKTAWTRFFSNGRTPVKNTETGETTGYSDNGGFMMFGVNGFNDSYGFNTDGKAILGLDAKGNKMGIDPTNGNGFPHRPPPSVDSVDVSLFGGQNASFSGLCRKARVNWKCYSLAQLEFLAPFFLAPKVTCLVEWGWNNYNPESLINLGDDGEDRGELLEVFLNGGKIMNKINASSGNYDAMIGFTTEYGFTMNALGGYDCFTEFVNANWLIEGQEYKNTSISSTSKDKVDANGTPIVEEKKSFIDFAMDDLENLTIVDSSTKEASGNLVIEFNTKGKTFSTTNVHNSDGKALGATEIGKWMRMDLVKDILNRYFSMKFKDSNNKIVGEGLLLDINTTIMCGHPALKSIDLNILIPNQFAPKFITKGSMSTGKDFLDGVKAVSHPEVGDYMTTFKDSGVVSQIKSMGLSTAYDNLWKLINESGESFPVYRKGIDENNKFSDAGMWGYLKDIYISTKLFQDLVKQNDTYLRLVQSLCDNISNAFSGVVQLKVLPHEHSAKFTIQDMNYNPKSTPDAVINLPKFTPGSVNSAFMTSAEFSIKLSQEMINQMVAQSSEGKNASGLTGDIQKVGPQKVSRFMGSDRLYEVGRLADIPAVEVKAVAPTTPPTAPPPHPRAFPGKKFQYYQEKGGKSFILVEPDPAFMREVLTKDVSGKTIYINSPIMSGTKFSMTTLGIGGFTFLGQFTLDHVPTAYSFTNCVWQIADIKQTIAGGLWNTTITADCRPLSFIKKAKT